MPAFINVLDLNYPEFDYRIDRQLFSMYYHRLVYTLLNYHVHSVIDDITGQVALAGNPEAALPAEKAY